MRFALNHITDAEGSRSRDFFALARDLGITEVEIRNDLPDVVGTVPPGEVRKAAAEKAGVELISINALYPFNVWSGDLPARAVALADYARPPAPRALVMCPLNDGTPVAHADLVAALGAMAPILRERGLIGLVEPLGFPISSLRTKRKRSHAIDAAGGADVYRLVHDTFHHHLAGETEFFPTGPASSISRAWSIRRSPSRRCSTRTACWSTAPTGWGTCRRSGRCSRRLRRSLQLRAVRAGGPRPRRSRRGARRGASTTCRAQI